MHIQHVYGDKLRDVKWIRQAAEKKQFRFIRLIFFQMFSASY